MSLTVVYTRAREWAVPLALTWTPVEECNVSTWTKRYIESRWKYYTVYGIWFRYILYKTRKPVRSAGDLAVRYRDRENLESITIYVFIFFFFFSFVVVNIHNVGTSYFHNFSIQLCSMFCKYSIAVVVRQQLWLFYIS